MSSTFTAVNPIIVGTKHIPELRKNLPVAASQTWKKGTPVIITSGEVTICTDGDIPCGQAADDITTAQTQGTDVGVILWNVGTRLEMYVYSGDTPTAAAASQLGVAYDLRILNSTTTAVGTIDVNATTDKVFRVIDLAYLYEPERNNAADTPGKVLVEVMKVA